MTNRSAVVYPVVLSLMVALVPGLFSACTSNGTGIGQPFGDAQAPDGTARTGGLAGPASTGGARKTGGIVASSGGAIGGVPGTGGSLIGGIPATGGSPLGGVRATGGVFMGGAPATGGTGTGGIRITGGTITVMGGTITGGRPGPGGIASGGIVNTGGAGGVATGGIRVDAGSEVSLPPPDTREAGPATCTQLTTQAACDDRNDCHAVFVDLQTCGCMSPGCCMRFSKCATGGQAKCTSEALCNMVAPTCDGPYVLAYSGLCYEGCVRQTACAGNDSGTPAVDAPLPVDTAPDVSTLSNCSNPLACKAGEIPIRIGSLPTNQCGCEPNPCSTTFPTCACAGQLCTKYNATCSGYSPGSGYLDCTPN